MPTPNPTSKIEPTVRQQFEAIVEGIEQEAMEAARVLNFDTRSRKKLLADIADELGFWKQEYFWDGGELLDELVKNSPTGAKPWDRVVCVQVIGILLEEIRTWLQDDDVFSILDDLDSNLNVLRQRLVTAAQKTSKTAVQHRRRK